jgi:hypothetical protein
MVLLASWGAAWHGDRYPFARFAFFALEIRRRRKA